MSKKLQVLQLPLVRKMMSFFSPLLSLMLSRHAKNNDRSACLQYLLDNNLDPGFGDFALSTLLMSCELPYKIDIVGCSLKDYLAALNLHTPSGVLTGISGLTPLHMEVL